MKKKIGLHFLLGFKGPTLPSWLVDFEARFGLGGVILFDYDFTGKKYGNNITSPEQLRKLNTEIHKLSSAPLIMVDQEGGKVRRLKENLGFAPLPSQKDLAMMSLETRREYLEKSFQELKHLGFDYNLAPVIDLDTNPNNPDIGAIGRSYSEDPKQVIENVSLLNEVAQKMGIGLCLKHYPGLGGAQVNSHEEITNLTGTFSKEQLDLFHRLAPSLSGNAILVSHGIVDDWEKGKPCSLSADAIRPLRARLPDTLLISDDLQMGALQKRCSTEKAVLECLKAGIDLVCIGNNLIDEQYQMSEIALAVEREVVSATDLSSALPFSIARIEKYRSQIQSV